MSKEAKPWYKSKRFYSTIITAALPFIPFVNKFALSYPELYSGLLALMFGYVGVKTKAPIEFKKPTIPGVKK